MKDVIGGQSDVPGEALKSEFLSEQANAIRRFCHTLRCRVSNITDEYERAILVLCLIYEKTRIRRDYENH
jgi:hypothetical protein